MRGNLAFCPHSRRNEETLSPSWGKTATPARMCPTPSYSGMGGMWGLALNRGGGYVYLTAETHGCKFPAMLVAGVLVVVGHQATPPSCWGVLSMFSAIPQVCKEPRKGTNRGYKDGVEGGGVLVG